MKLVKLKELEGYTKPGFVICDTLERAPDDPIAKFKCAVIAGKYIMIERSDGCQNTFGRGDLSWEQAKDLEKSLNKYRNSNQFMDIVERWDIPVRDCL
jgi:hypothetical protein